MILIMEASSIVLHLRSAPRINILFRLHSVEGMWSIDCMRVLIFEPTALSLSSVTLDISAAESFFELGLGALK